MNRINALLLTATAALVATLAASPAFAQDDFPKGMAQLEFSAFTDFADMTDEGLLTAQQHDKHTAPLGIALRAGLSNNWSLEGRAKMTNIFPIQQNRIWPFGGSSEGKYVSFSALVGHSLFADWINAHAGFQWDYFERNLLVQTGFARFSPNFVATTNQGPVVGAYILKAPEKGFTVNAGMDVRFFVMKKDTFGNGSSKGSPSGYGQEYMAKAGYNFFSYTGVYGGINYSEVLSYGPSVTPGQPYNYETTSRIRIRSIVFGVQTKLF